MRWFLLAFLCALLFVGACGDDDQASPRDDGDPLSGNLTVFAASSLTDAFEEIAADFGDLHPDVTISFNFAGSSELRTQLEQGAPADVFASANTSQMDQALASGVVGADSPIFARNRLVVIVPKANEAGIDTLQDLAEDGVKVVLAGEDVPVGAYSRDFLENASADPAFGVTYGADVLANVVSEETNVKQVVARIQIDEADAGIVYTTDVTDEVAGDVTTIEIPDALNKIAQYPIAPTSDAGNPALAQVFIDFVLSNEGQAILADHGFIVEMTNE